MTARAYALVLAVALAVAAPSLRNGFVYDDVPAVQHDPRLDSFANFREMVTGPYWNGNWKDRIWRPATTISFAVDYQLGGGGPLLFHATNVALHLLVVLLVAALAARFMGPGAVVAGLWFAVHPVHVEAVANVVGRSELLAAAFYLMAALAYTEAGSLGSGSATRRMALTLSTLLCAAVAYSSKEHALTLPAALVLMDYWEARRTGEPPGPRLRRQFLLWLAVVALAAGYLTARAAVLGSALEAGNVAAGLEGLGAGQRAVVMLPGFLVWLRWLVFPLELSADYSPAHFVPQTLVGPAHVASLSLIGLMAWLCRRVKARAPLVLFGAAWFCITASVAANIVAPTGVLLAERVMYLPTVGAAVAVAAAWGLLPAPPVTWYATAAVLALLGARSVARAAVWRDEARFREALISDAPGSYRAHWALGATALNSGDPREGERHYLEAVRIYPLDASLLQELGERYLAAGLYQPADRFLSASLKVDSARTDVAVAAVVARTRLGRPDSAVALGEKYLRRFPDAPTLLAVTLDAHLSANQPRRALGLARRLTWLDQAKWEYQQLAGYAAARAGRCDEAAVRLARAAVLAPPGDTLVAGLQARLTRSPPSCGIAAP